MVRRKQAGNEGLETRDEEAACGVTASPNCEDRPEIDQRQCREGKKIILHIDETWVWCNIGHRRVFPQDYRDLFSECRLQPKNPRLEGNWRHCQGPILEPGRSKKSRKNPGRLQGYGIREKSQKFWSWEAGRRDPWPRQVNPAWSKNDIKESETNEAEKRKEFFLVISLLCCYQFSLLACAFYNHAYFYLRFNYRSLRSCYTTREINFDTEDPRGSPLN